MRIGIFGGSFDPVHVGHMAAAQEAAHAYALAHVLFVPANHQPLKAQAPRAFNDDRLAMLQLAVAGNERFALSRAELDRPAPSYTVETLRGLRDSYGPDVELFVLLGMDAVNTLDRWREPATLLRLARIVAMSRGQVREPDWERLQAIAPDARQRIELLSVPDLNISSHDLRRRVAEGLPIRYQVQDAVREYIVAHDLYTTPHHALDLYTTPHHVLD